MSKSKTIYRDKLFFLIPLAVVAILIASKFRAVNGYWGHDYYYSLTRLFIGSVHFWQNPFSLPHYTASLCGGVPFFADPQNPYFSLPQGLAFLIDPLRAIHLTYLIAYGVAYIGMERLLRRGFDIEMKLAHFGAVLFILNGFMYENFFVGHLTHHSYVLFPWILLNLLEAPDKKARDNCIGVSQFPIFQSIPLALSISYIIYSGGFHMLFSLGMLLFVSLPLLVQRQRRLGTLGVWGRTILISGILILLICSGKLWSTALYAKHFYVNPLHVSNFGLFDLVGKYFWFRPEAMADMRRFGNMLLGPWEYVGFISKITIPLLFVGALYSLRTQPFLKLLSLIPALCVLLWACGMGGNTSIPILKLYHNPIKLLGVFIIPIIIISIRGASNLIGQLSKRLLFFKFGKLGFFLGVLCIGAEFSYYADYFRRHPYISNYSYSPELYTTLKTNGMTPVNRVINEHDWDIVGLKVGCTSLKCYEPLFGYEYQGLKTKLVTRETRTLADGNYNLSHPGCLLYPEFFNCSAWDRIPLSDKVNFEKFIQGKEAWGIPFWHRAIYWTNLLSFFIVCSSWLIFLLSKTFTDKKYFSTVFTRTIRA